MVINSGSFMSDAAGGTNGAGPALQRLLALRNQGASPSPMNGNSVNPSAIPPAAPSQVSVIPGKVPSLQPQPVPSVAPAGAPSPMAAPQQAQQQTGNPELSIALNALASYISSHGKALEARHDVALKNAQAKAMQPPAQGGE